MGNDDSFTLLLRPRSTIQSSERLTGSMHVEENTISHAPSPWPHCFTEGEVERPTVPDLTCLPDVPGVPSMMKAINPYNTTCNYWRDCRN